jgi:uncharacterized protein (TIGR00369 family)
MAELKSPDFSGYDPRIAAAMVEANNQAVVKGAKGLQTFLGVHFDTFEPGRLRASMEVRDEHVTIMGTLHGGVMAGFVDHVMGCVLYPLMSPGQWAATTEFKLNYLAPVKEGRLSAESTVLALGRRSAVVRVDVASPTKLICLAQGTLLISEPPAARSA